MISTKRSVLLASLIFGMLYGGRSQSATGQDRLEEAVQPLLWEIVGDKTSYLFGTIHITDERCTTLHPAAAEAFDKCDTLFVEMSPSDQFNQLNAITLTDTTTEELLDADLIRRIDAQLEEINPVLSHATLPTFKIYAWGLVLPSLEAQLKNPNALILDMKLVSMAEQSDRDVHGLEDPASQLEGMDALTKDEQLAFLRETLRSMEEADENDEDPEAELAEMYLQGDVDKLEEFFEEELAEGEFDEELIEKIMAAMLHDRNKRIADKIVEVLEESPDKSFFFAAGTAHFVGDKSVQRYLREQGIEVRRVGVAEAVGADD